MSTIILIITITSRLTADVLHHVLIGLRVFQIFVSNLKTKSLLATEISALFFLLVGLVMILWFREGEEVH